MKITFLIDNKTESTECDAEWGLSVLIEANGKKILMDQGASPMLVRNAERMGLDLSNVDFATISHGHNDHTGGLKLLSERCEVNGTELVYVPEVFSE